jgi:hypothetical protein
MLAPPSFHTLRLPPSHARHIQSWHSLVALFCFLFLLSSLPAALVLAHLCSSISLSPLFSAGLACMIIFILSSFHSPLSVRSLFSLVTRIRATLVDRMFLRLHLLPPPLCLSASLPFTFFSLCLSLISALSERMKDTPFFGHSKSP